MRMKFNKPSQLALVAVASLLVATMLTACETLTVDFVFVTSAQAAGPNNYGVIDVFEINSESGQMRQIPTSPFPSGGRNPVAEALTSDNTNLFVVNKDDNTIVQFIIGNDGKVYAQNTTNTPGIFPMAVAVSGSNLFVVDTYQPLPTCSPAAPCSGSIGAFPISTATTGHPPDHGGFNFDGCAPETLLERAKVKDGRVVFPGGASYRILVLPELRTMTPALLAKIKSLVRAGATVFGPPPEKSPSGCDCRSVR